MSNNVHPESRGAITDAPLEEGDELPVENELPAIRGTQALERLRERVDVAARELIRLRRENAALGRKLAELEARPVSDDASIIRSDEDVDALKTRIDGFIQAIDYYLAQERKGETGG